MKKEVCSALAVVLCLAGAAASAASSPSVLKVIARGGTIHGANGVMFDEDDNLHIASVAGREIIVMDPKTGKIIGRLGTEVGVEGPDDVAFGPDGSLYWTSFLTGEVGRLSPDGVKTGQFLAPGVNPISFSDDGRLFVALDFLGDGLYELDPELLAPPRPIIAATPANPFPLGFLNAFDFGPDGRLYGPIWMLGMVVSIDVDSCDPTPTDNPWVDCDIRVVAGFDVPAAAKFDSLGGLHVVDHSGAAFKVDTETGDKTLIATLQKGSDNLAFDSRDRLFISNADHSSVVQILPSGTPRFIYRGGMVLPGGVAVVPNPHGGDSVFVADVFSLREFNGLTGKTISVEESVVGFSDLTSPFTVSADGAYLVLSSWFGGEVQVWDPENRHVVHRYPMPVPLNAIRFQDDLVVADLGLGGVVWASTGNLIVGAPHQVFVPTGLATSGNTLWVVDWATGIAWQLTFDDDGNLLGQTPIAFGLDFPEGLALDLDGSLLVVETGAGSLSRIDPGTGAVTVVAEGLELGAPGVPGLVPTWMFNGVAVGPSGAIYITGDIANVIYRIWPR